MLFKRTKLPIRDRVVLITGAANGIGRALAKKIKSRGGIPVCVDLASESLDSLASELGEGALVAACDVSDAAGMQRIVDLAVERFDGISVVVANAGIERVDPVWRMPAEEFERVLAVNILGVYRTIRPAIRHVMRRKGHIVAVSSVSALVPWPQCAAYGRRRPSWPPSCARSAWSSLERAPRPAPSTSVHRHGHDEALHGKGRV
jgi:NAD(P)-dependent dehydrogenase (short-subunit alcohol dehydrogenase family)